MIQRENFRLAKYGTNLFVDPYHVQGLAAEWKEELQVFLTLCQLLKVLAEVLIDGVFVPSSFAGVPAVLPPGKLVNWSVWHLEK